MVRQFDPDLLAATGSPLSFAIHTRDTATLRVVHEAIRHGHVMLAYQPVVQARRPQRIAFYEGLARAQDQTGRIIPAGEFIDAIEETEDGRILDCLALEMGLGALRTAPSLRLAINMSANSIGYPRWRETLERGLRDAPTVAERLILEITERTAMVVPDIVAVFMEELNRRGIAFALDDFGAGYTAFRYFKDFYFDILKIDGQFIRNIHDDANNQVLTEALVLIARKFDMFTVAEAVETVPEAEFLAAAGLDCLQGYLFGAPALGAPWKEPVKHRAAG